MVLAQHCTDAKGDAYGLVRGTVGASLHNLIDSQQKEEKKIFGVAMAVGMTIAMLAGIFQTELTQWRYG